MRLTKIYGILFTAATLLSPNFQATAAAAGELDSSHKFCGAVSDLATLSTEKLATLEDVTLSTSPYDNGKLLTYPLILKALEPLVAILPAMGGVTSLKLTGLLPQPPQHAALAAALALLPRLKHIVLGGVFNGDKPSTDNASDLQKAIESSCPGAKVEISVMYP